jgi:hypothetical protein
VKAGARLAAAFSIALAVGARAAPTASYGHTIGTKFAVPGHDDGFVPQGLAFFEGDLWLSGYLWPLRGAQSCRIYRLDLQGHVKGMRDLPTACRHAGGMAATARRLFVADTHRLIEIDPELVFQPESRGEPIRRAWALIEPVIGSFLAARGDDLWIGSYETSGAPKLWRMPLADIDALPDGAGVSELQAANSIPAPLKSQGAAFAQNGALWVSQSGQRFGRLTQIDAATGQARGRSEAPSGIEGVAFDGSGRMWAVSETGSKRWAQAPSPFPYVYSISVEAR